MTDHDKATAAALEQIDRAFGKGSSEIRTLPATMTERVARELCRQEFVARSWRGDDLGRLVDENWRDYIPDARSIFGTMCRPTEEMLDDVEGWQPKDEYQNLETAREQIVFIWQTMLTSAAFGSDADELARKERQAEADRKWREAGCPSNDEDPPF